MKLIACKGRLGSLLEDLGYSKKRVTKNLKLLLKIMKISNIIQNQIIKY